MHDNTDLFNTSIFASYIMNKCCHEYYLMLVVDKAVFFFTLSKGDLKI